MRASFHFVDLVGDIVHIQDDGGQMSITNDAEAVYDYIQKIYPGVRLVYTDEYGERCELTTQNGQIVFNVLY
jgi:hypothetical protein